MKEIWIQLIDLFLEENDEDQCEDLWHKLTYQEQKEFIELLQNKYDARKYDSMYAFYSGLYKMTKPEAINPCLN